VEGADPAVAAPHQDQRPAGQIDRHHIARFGQIAREGDGAPEPGKQMRLFQGVKGVAVTAPRQATRLAGRAKKRRAFALRQKVGKGLFGHFMPPTSRIRKFSTPRHRRV